jgi:hypothetical protein
MSEYEDKPRCLICASVATHYAVVTGRSWFDRIPFLRWISQLQAMPWRYAIIEDWHQGLKYCAPHRRDAESILEQAHAKMRAEHAEFNARQQAKITVLDHGGLDQMLRRDFESILESIGLAAKSETTQPRQLEAVASVVHMMPVASTGKDSAE